MRKPLLILALAGTFGLTQQAAFADHNSPHGAGWARMPNDIHNTRIDTLGDNTAFSYDGRYFGPVDQASLVGPAFVVYWPFTRRWGLVR